MRILSFFTGWPGSDYPALAQENRLLCLDEYLTSEEGKRLYDILCRIG